MASADGSTRAGFVRSLGQPARQSIVLSPLHWLTWWRQDGRPPWAWPAHISHTNYLVSGGSTRHRTPRQRFITRETFRLISNFFRYRLPRGRSEPRVPTLMPPSARGHLGFFPSSYRRAGPSGSLRSERCRASIRYFRHSWTTIFPSRFTLFCIRKNKNQRCFYFLI